MRIREQQYRSLVESVTDYAIFMVDVTGHVASWTPVAERLIGYSAEEIIGQPSTLLDSSQHAPEFYREMRETMELTGRWSGEMWQRRKDGYCYWTTRD